MTKRELTALILKLLGVYAIIQSLPHFQPLIRLLRGLVYESERVQNQVSRSLTMSIPFALLAGTGIILLTNSRSLAYLLVKDDSDAKLATTLRAEEVQAIGFSIVGVLVFLLAVPRLAQFIGYAWFIASLRTSQASVVPFVATMWQNGLSFVVQCSLAIVLFFRARGLANLWHRIQAGK